MSPPRLGILVSGRGSNMQAIIDACASGALAGEVGLVLANKPDTPALAAASASGLDTDCVDHRDFDSREAFDATIVARLQARSIDVVVLAGFMRILTPVFIEPFHGCLFNIHPSLLPKYPGLNTHQRAIDAGDAEAGSTVHFVTRELDGGPPVLQARLPITNDDSADSLAARVLELEHRIYPLALQWYVTGRLHLRADGAYLDGERLPPQGADFATIASPTAPTP